MNTDLVNRLPIELRREIYMHLPQKHCSVCNQIVVRWPHINENRNTPWVCSIPCLTYYNYVIGKDIIVFSCVVEIANIISNSVYLCMKTGMVMLSGTIFVVYVITYVYIVWGLIRCLMYFAKCLFYFF